MMTVKCTHSNEMGHFIAKIKGQIVLLASQLDELYMGLVHYLDFLPFFSSAEHINILHGGELSPSVD